MELNKKLLSELQRRLKIGNRRGIHLNAIPANSRYKFDLNRLANIDKNLPNNFIHALLTEQPLKFKISWKDNVPDLNSLFEEDQTQLVKITKGFENLINQTEAIESEKGINTFGFGFPLLVRRDQADNKLTVSPILIWSLRIKRTKEFNTWEINRSDDDPVYLNEVLINHLQSDSNIELGKIPSEMLDDGLISKDELIEICTNLINEINPIVPSDLADTFRQKLENISSIGDRNHYEKLPLNSTNAFIDFCGLFSIFEVQKQNIINDYGNLMELEGLSIDLEDMEGHTFQPISSVETDPSQQSILHALEASRNILIQGPPGTGKSQTLTAILVNALENHRKTIVVCEKRTALKVLHDALIEKHLNYHCVLIRDIITDRRAVVDSVRDRVDNSSYKRYSYKYSKESLDNLINKANDLINSINNKHKKLDDVLLDNKSWTDIVGKWLAELAGNKEDYNLDLEKDFFCFSSQEMNSMLDLVQKGQLLYNDYKPFESISFLNPNNLIGDNPYVIEQKIHEDFDIYNKLLVTIKSLLSQTKKEYFILRKEELDQQFSEYSNFKDLILNKDKEFEELLANNKIDYLSYRNSEFENQINNLNVLINQIDSIFEYHKNNPDLLNDEKVTGYLYKTLSVFSKPKKKTLADYKRLQEYFNQLENVISASKDFENVHFLFSTDINRKDFITFKSALIEKKNNFSKNVQQEFEDFNFRSAFDFENLTSLFESIDKSINESSDSVDFQVFLNKIREIFYSFISDVFERYNGLSSKLKTNKDIISTNEFCGSLNKKKAVLFQVNSEIELSNTRFDSKTQTEFQGLNFFKINPGMLILATLPKLKEKIEELYDKILKDNWSSKTISKVDFNGFINEMEILLEKKQNYFSAENDQFTIEFKWFQFYNDLSVSNNKLINELKSKCNWRKTFLIFYFNSMLVNAANMDLPTNDSEHIELNSTLNGIENEQLKYVKEFWFSKQIDTTREFELKNRNLSVENLYNKRSSNRFKRLSLRQIVQYDPNLFTTFFPIILTSPDVCCNLFKGMNGYFDIVMFDEASQLRLEDTLPAILKGRQIIISGDEHQMPPSNYFSKVFDGSIEDEDDIEEDDEIKVDKDNLLLSCESLLDFGEELNFEKKHLDFHYRSRHPYLIDFSNYAFYKQRLKPLPNDFDYTPIKYIQVNGTFSDYTNDVEAEIVLSILENNICRLPDGNYPTIGVATFNIAQRNLIKSKILERQKFSKHEAFNAKIQELEEKGMFIKNLENIQGDEKDVIILSTTYGIGKGGKFAQRFGPINHSKGYKLLNVIITRAKYKIYVCSSVPEPVFMNYKEYLTIEGNNKRAVFYAYLAYCKAVSDCSDDLRLSVLTALSENSVKSTNIDIFRGGELDSPFEEEVYQALADKFGVENLIPQLHFAGFKIDIVYDPKISGIPKIAIECDGAKYHSSREAYLYDRHRQKILENHGFVFHRIWSTNWWRNHGKETARLVYFIKNTISTSTKGANRSEPDPCSAFNDDIVNLNVYAAQNSFIDHQKEVETIKSIENKTVEKIQVKNEVKRTSKVKVKYINNGKDITVQIGETTVVADQKPNGIQNINIKSPLAISIIGHSVGDIIKVGNLDNFVEIIEILN